MLRVMLFLHVISVVVWVGGMFFAYVALRPAAAELLQPPQRLPLWAGTFRRFFLWVWVSVALILASGLHLMFGMGGFAGAPLHVHAMFGIGVAMMLIFAHVFFAPYGRLRSAVETQDWKAGGAALGQIRMLVGINLTLGIVTVAVATLGPLAL